MKSLLLFTCLSLSGGSLWSAEFQKFGSREMGTQLTAGIAGAGLGYLYLQGSLAAESTSGTVGLSAGQTLAGISLGYTLGILFCGKLFQGRGNPFLTFFGNVVPFAGPLIAYHLTAGSVGFSESLALFNLTADKLSLGLPIPYRRLGRFDQTGEVLYYLNLVIINL